MNAALRHDNLLQFAPQVSQISKLTDDGVSGDLLRGRSSGGRRSVGQKIAQRQRRGDDLAFLLEIQVIQTVAPLRPGDDRHRFRRVMMVMVMVLLMQIVLDRQIVWLLVAGLVARARHQVDAAHAYGHRRRAILETAALLPPPGAEDRDQARQRSYRLLASWSILTATRSRGRLAFLVTSRQLHGSAF